MAAGFASRMIRDACAPKLTFTTSPTKQTITGVTVTCNSNTCSELIPVTLPGDVSNTHGYTTEQLGSDPLTSKFSISSRNEGGVLIFKIVWVKMKGSPVKFTLVDPIPF